MPVHPPSPTAPVARARRIRVAIVDDSAVVRGFFARWLAECGDMEVVGLGADGFEAIAIAASHAPDVLVLDIEMPKLDGLQALGGILRAAPGCRVLISSRLTLPGARLGLRCLEAGARDVLGKPGFDRNLGALAHFRHELIGKIRALSPDDPGVRDSGPAHGRRRAAQAVARLRATRRSLMPHAVMIGASTGGPQAVSAVLKGFAPAVQAVPVIVVQHMPALFTSVFAEHLVRLTGLACHEAQDGDLLKPGFVYIAQGGHHTLVARDGERLRLRVNDDPPVRFARPSIDLLIESGAAALGARGWCVLLTGMGQDGLIGAQAIAAAGGRVFAQDEASSVVWGMPGAVVRAGIADETGDPSGLAARMMALMGECLP